MDINLTEALLCTRSVGPHMLARRSGKVINIASWTAHQGGRDMVLYTTAKTALAGFTRAQALEWAPYGVHVNAIAPGIFPDVVTSGEERVRQSTQRAEQTVPLRRPGRLREVGLLALYLASGASDYMTGQTIFLDGGLGL
jgi:2-deoxy-D-gluconate 3-dehydrogenase